MSLIIPIPLSNGLPITPAFSIQISLEGVTYTLSFTWNIRADSWFLDIYDETGLILLRAGLRVVANWPLGAYAAVHNPPGALTYIDNTGKGKRPSVDDFGVNGTLLYVTSQELGL